MTKKELEFYRGKAGELQFYTGVISCIVSNKALEKIYGRRIPKNKILRGVFDPETPNLIYLNKENDKESLFVALSALYHELKHHKNWAFNQKTKWYLGGRIAADELTARIYGYLEAWRAVKEFEHA